MSGTLVALMGDDRMGQVVRDARGRTKFVYDEAWRTRRGAYPLSLSMPLALAEHPHAVVDAYLWGLLPDNEIIVERWAQRFHVSPRSAFALLAHVGEDCAGAVRFATPERIRTLAREDRGTVEWLDEGEIADRLRALRRDASAWWRVTDGGQFSLAGAQPKTALFFDGKRWGVPNGRIPTTHILKPGVPDLIDHASNEHFCLVLAQCLGLPAATSRVMRFEDEMAIVVERYDRISTRGRIVRVHQEDICQALGVHPASKYESEGGPGVRDVVLLGARGGGRTDPAGSALRRRQRPPLRRQAVAQAEARHEDRRESLPGGDRPIPVAEGSGRREPRRRTRDRSRSADDRKHRGCGRRRGSRGAARGNRVGIGREARHIDRRSCGTVHRRAVATRLTISPSAEAAVR